MLLMLQCVPVDTLDCREIFKVMKIVIHSLTFAGQVAKSIRTLELNFNFLSSAPHSAQLMGVVMIGRSHARHAAKCSR